MKIDQYHLSFIGFGHMAQIIFTKIHAARLIPLSQTQFVQRDPDKSKRNEQTYKMTATSLEHAASSSDVLLLCVRPNQLQAVLPRLAQVKNKMIISILAGVPISTLQASLDQSVQIARVMPNVASAVGEGVTTLSFSPDSSGEFRFLVEQLVAPLGHSIELPETQMDIATAIAGSGPGFVFKLIQAMADAGVKEGLSLKQALFMAAQTFLGAARLVMSKGEIDSLVQQIATPGGVTEAGFLAMERLEIAKSFQQTIEVAKQKAQSL
ncbi:MAG: pyrroline-5-carboxylate reductase [Chlamydiales bacterium]|nr:pyrroline-5-carboxylate reductase [Chlamydiales bacterium]